MNAYREQIAAALRAVAIRGPVQYTWLGRRSRPLPAPVLADLGADERRRYLAACLREELYFSFYCHGRPVAARWGEPQPFAPDPGLVREMSRANSGVGGWEAGWIVGSVADGEALVSCERLRVRVPVRELDGEARPGAEVRLWRPKELPAFSPGFWTALGDAPGGTPAAGDVRVYWNVTRTGAPMLVRALTARLNGDPVRFRLKVADHPFRLDRCDAAVLYLAAGDFHRVRPLLAEVSEGLAGHLGRRVPAFTLPFAVGVGLAEDDSGESFGTRRCALLAEAIVHAHEQGLTRLDERVAAVAARFAEDGVDIDAPYRDLAERHVL